MLVTRHSDTELSPWPFNKLETSFPRKSSPSPRMSNSGFEAPLSTGTDWQGQYSFLPPGEHIFSQSYDHVTSSSDNTQSQGQQRPGTTENGLDVEVKVESSPLGHRRSLDPLGLRQHKAPSPIPERAEAQGEAYAQKAAESAHEESLVSTDTPGLSLGSNPLSSVSSAGQVPEITTNHTGNGEHAGIKEAEEDLIDDEEMVEGDGEAVPQPQTAAERTAQKRKMKRFRLTHQQTRFLMSEFAKQPHPDAAHRERLSREIPGLSPRQVQVWFQNRRAKIKRLTADDRDRMIKMRAVPDDFDNVQALHSPYGAVHALGTPITSPVDFGASAYADHMMRPLMVDVRRPEGDDHLSPTGLSPAFGNIGFNPSAMSTSDILSPLSPTSNDRYGYSSHLSAPLSASSRSSNPFARQNSLDTGMQMHSHHQRQQQIRPLQPLQLRETMSRSRSDNLQSPLRSSMSWKGDSIDYTTYHAGNAGSPQLGGRQQSIYQPESMGTTPTTLGGYESSAYSGSTVQSPTHMNYSGFQSSSLQQNSQSRSRLRAASATLPLGLDLRTQYRSVGAVGTGHGMSSTAQSPTTRPTSTSQLGGGSSSYTGSFPSAPLTAPIDFSLPRTPGFRSTGQDYSMPQMSAPIAPPNDFSQAFQASMTSSSSRTPMRDSFSGSTTLGMGQGQGSGDRSDDFSHDSGLSAGMKRKHSFTLSQGGPTSTTSAASTYGSTA